MSIGQKRLVYQRHYFQACHITLHYRIGRGILAKAQAKYHRNQDRAGMARPPKKQVIVLLRMGSAGVEQHAVVQVDLLQPLPRQIVAGSMVLIDDSFRRPELDAFSAGNDAGHGIKQRRAQPFTASGISCH